MSSSQHNTPYQFHRVAHRSLKSAEALCLELRRFILGTGIADLCFSIELLARECLNNAVIHGAAQDADNTVDLTLSVGRKWVRLKVEDHGPGFQWQKALKRQPHNVALSGRGLQICALYAERLRFNRSGNAVELWIKAGRKE